MLRNGLALRKQRPAPGDAQPGTVRFPAGLDPCLGKLWDLAPGRLGLVRCPPFVLVCKPQQSVQEGAMPPALPAWLLLGGPHHRETGGRRRTLCCPHRWRGPLPLQLRDPGDEEAVQPRDFGEKPCCCLLARRQRSEQHSLLLPPRDSSFYALRETGPCRLLEGTSTSLRLHGHGPEMGCSGAVGLRLEGTQVQTETFWRCQETHSISFPPRV